MALLFAIPLLTFLLSQTNDYHQLFYAGLEYSQTNGLAIAQINRGPWYYVHTAYGNVCFLAYNALLLRSCIQAQPLYRIQALLLVVASLAPWVCMLLFLIGLTPNGIDLNPFGLAVAGVISAVAVWRYEFLNLVPMARDVVFNSIEEGVVIVDESLCIVDFNRAATTIFPALCAEQIGTPLTRLLDAQTLNEVFPREGSGRLQSQTPEGPRDYEVKHYPLRGHKNVALGQAILIQDVTARLDLERKLVEMATHDELTGLHNRHYLMTQAEHAVQIALRHGRALSVLIGDIDNFKQVNDERGHLAGDALLQQVAQCLNQRLRQTDICSRYGGDEFVIVLPETGLKEAHQIAAALQDTILSQTGNGLSIGSAALQADTPDFRSLLQQADANLYAHKAARKRCDQVSLVG